MSMTAVAAHENTMVQSVLLRNTLANRVNRIPLHPVPFNVIWLQYLLSRCLHFLWSGLFSRVEILISRGRYLDVKANHVILSWYYHNRAMIAVYGAFHLLLLVHPFKDI